MSHPFPFTASVESTCSFYEQFSRQFLSISDAESFLYLKEHTQLGSRTSKRTGALLPETSTSEGQEVVNVLSLNGTIQRHILYIIWQRELSETDDQLPNVVYYLLKHPY